MGVARYLYLDMVCNQRFSALEIVLGTWNLLAELVMTKPWCLLRGFRPSRAEKPDFATLQVTANLELALRHLRREQRPRTLWVDALCINQKDEDEKQLQVQRMDWMFANASPVVVWLGGYHEIGRGDVCGEPPLPGADGCCIHERQIQAAFRLIRSFSGWRFLVPSYFKRDMGSRLPEALLGIRELCRRGWWKRLWVIQEVLLATALVRIQCGQDECDSEDFLNTQYRILEDRRDDEVLKHDSEPCRRLTTLIRDFRYSRFHDREDPLVRKFALGATKLTHLLSRDESILEARFHEQPFAERLQRVLLKTAGDFQCRDDRDKLYAVLGIAGGARTARTTMVAKLVKFMSSITTVHIIASQMEPLFMLKAPGSLWWKIAQYAFPTLYTQWAIYYDSVAQHWAVSRPYYVVSGYEHVVKAVAGGPAEQRPSRAEFFTALARYLARETKSLAFLDAACCSEDQDEGMPSWVPSWTRRVGLQAYEFATRRKKEHRRARFRFGEGGKALELRVRPRGTVLTVKRIPDLADPQASSSWQPSDEEALLALPPEMRVRVRRAVTDISGFTSHGSSMPSESEREMVSLLLKLMKSCVEAGRRRLLNHSKHGGKALVYSYGKGAGGVGFLMAGQTARGDLLVSVPDCFHYLVLRRHGQTATGGPQWKLVGLVALVGQDGGGCPKSDGEEGTEDEYKCTII